MTHLKIPLQSLYLSEKNILKEIGYKDKLPDEVVIWQIREQLSILAEHITAEGAFQVFKGTLFQEQIVLEPNKVLNPGGTIFSLLKGASSFAVFVATLGVEFEKYVHDINKENDILRAYIVDVIGSYAVERIGDLLEKELELQIGNSLHTNRFSPGYCGWNLSEQADIFGLLEDCSCGITLSDSFLMTPIKSISGIMGIGESVKKKKYGCVICTMTNCYKRKTKIYETDE